MSKKISATNVAERPIRTKKAVAAAVTGAVGVALATTIIADIENAAKQESRREGNQKERLKALFAQGQPDHIAFRVAMENRMSQVSDTAKAAGIPLADYRAANGEANTVYTQCSLWKRLSKACEMGWVPDYTMHWSSIGASATKVTDTKAVAAAHEEAKPLLMERAKLLDDSKMEPTQKAEAVRKITADINQIILASPVVTGPKAKTSGRPEKALTAKLDELIKDKPLQEIEKLYAYLGEKIAAMKASKGKPVNVKPGETTTGKPVRQAPVKAKAKKQEPEHAVARGSKK